MPFTAADTPSAHSQLSLSQSLTFRRASHTKQLIISQQVRTALETRKDVVGAGHGECTALLKIERLHLHGSGKASCMVPLLPRSHERRHVCNWHAHTLAPQIPAGETLPVSSSNGEEALPHRHPPAWCTCASAGPSPCLSGPAQRQWPANTRCKGLSHVVDIRIAVSVGSSIPMMPLSAGMPFAQILHLPILLAQLISGKERSRTSAKMLALPQKCGCMRTLVCMALPSASTSNPAAHITAFAQSA